MHPPSLSEGNDYPVALLHEVPGNLKSSGDSGFAEMFERMILAATLTHEIYATVASFYSTGGGRFDPKLLEAYTEYLQRPQG